MVNHIEEFLDFFYFILGVEYVLKSRTLWNVFPHANFPAACYCNFFLLVKERRWWTLGGFPAFTPLTDNQLKNSRYRHPLCQWLAHGCTGKDNLDQTDANRGLLGLPGKKSQPPLGVNKHAGCFNCHKQSSCWPLGWGQCSGWQRRGTERTGSLRPKVSH